MKTGSLALPREVEGWLGPFGTVSKNGSLIAECELAVTWLGPLMLASVCIVGRAVFPMHRCDVEGWLGPAGVEANQESILSVGDMASDKAMTRFASGRSYIFTPADVV